MSILTTVWWACLLAGAPPPGDAFAAPSILTGLEGQIETTNREATAEEADPPFPDQSGRSLWWRWTPAVGGRATVHTLGSAFDTILGVYTVEGRALFHVAFNDDSSEHESYQSLVTFEAAARTEYAILVDGLFGEAGGIVLTWHLDGAVAPPPEDAFVARAALEGTDGRRFASNRLASREAGEPEHRPGADGRSLWYRWTAPTEGTLTLDTEGSALDSVLAVYDGPELSRLTPVAGDDDGGVDLTSWLSLDVLAGAEYAIALDSFGDEGGLLVLRWRFLPPCGPPAAPNHPLPGDGAVATSRNPVLRWNVDPAPERRVIYGADDRLEIHEVDDPALREAWRATAALVRMPRDAQDLGDGTYALSPLTYGEQAGLCPGERFASQPAPAWCTGFLVGPDLLVTAGHCVTDGIGCEELAIVFGFGMTKPGEIPLRIPASQVYRCAGVVASVAGPANEDEDWAVLRLDRAVPDSKPLRCRRAGKVANEQPLVVIGHPGGLPAKIAGGARVRDTSGAATFIANLDTFGGNSGSPVLSATSLLVEGILVAGEEDFIEGGECVRENRCPDGGCSGEFAVRTTIFEHWIPPLDDVVHDVYLGRCGDLSLAGTTSDTLLEIGLLDAATTYCWQVVSRGECGEQKGPVWSFTTGAAVAPSFRRGDATADGRRDITDAVVVLSYLFLGGAAPGCLASADADDSGIVEVTDAIYLLQHLFNGGPAPPWPFPGCGRDATPDALSCTAPPACPGG